MPTAEQIFSAACAQALEDLRDLPVEKTLNRLDIDVVMELQRALGQQFVLLLRHAASLQTKREITSQPDR